MPGLVGSPAQIDSLNNPPPVRIEKTQLHALGMLQIRRKEWVAAEKTLYRYVKNKSLPSGDINEDPTRTPPESLFFNLKWTFLPPRAWSKAE